MIFLDSVKDLIEVILSDKKLQDSRTVYRDEPIIHTAAQLNNYVPEKIRDMRKIARQCADHRECFYRQALFMQDFEDDFDFKGEFVRYFPTYEQMTDNQLRGYFSWRAVFRKGAADPAPLSFVYLHIYELINGVGAKTPLEGFNELKRVVECYPETDRYLKVWLGDYAVYYDLDKSLTGGLFDTDHDNSLIALRDYASHSGEEVFSALSALSAYNISRSGFFSQYPDDARTVLCRIYGALSEEFAKRSKKRTFFEKLFGCITECPYIMFSSAVFYGGGQNVCREYAVSDIHRFRCKNGSWFCEKYYGNRGKNRELGDIVRTADSVMREKYNFGKLIQPGTVAQYTLKIIERVIDGFLAEKKKNEAAKIEIDLSKLDGIRLSADATRDKLIADESFEEIFAELAVLAEPAEPEENPDVLKSAELPLNEIEYKFLYLLLSGGDCGAFLREKGLPISVAADGVNEKLFDMFGDTVIDFDGDKPMLVEDYAEELKGLILK